MNELKNAICPQCGVIQFDEIDIENIEENGMCMMCDEMNYEIMEDRQDDVEEIFE